MSIHDNTVFTVTIPAKRMSLKDEDGVIDDALISRLLNHEMSQNPYCLNKYTVRLVSVVVKENGDHVHYFQNPENFSDNPEGLLSKE